MFYQLQTTHQKTREMNDIKKGDKRVIKATGKTALIAYASTTLQNNFYLLTVDGILQRDSSGDIKEFHAEDLDYTDEQKLHFEYEADLHSDQVNEQNYYHFHNR